MVIISKKNNMLYRLKKISNDAPILLDYFEEGHRYGVLGTGVDRTSIGHDSTNFSYFNTNSFQNGVPYGTFDNAYNDTFEYDFNDSLRESTGNTFTIEFFIRMSGNYYRDWNIVPIFEVLFNNDKYCRFVPQINSSSNFMYINMDYKYDNISTSNTLLYGYDDKTVFPNGNQYFNNWKHVAIVFSGKIVCGYVNGIYRYATDFNDEGILGKLRLFGRMFVNTDFSYDITQLAVFNYVRYSGKNFTVNPNLLINQYPEVAK